MERVALVHTQGARATVEASAPRVELSRSTSGLLAFDAGIHLLGRDVFVQAGRLEGSLDQGHLEGSSGVTLRTAQGTTGTSPRVSFDRSAGAQGGASSDAGVRLRGDGFALEAQGFEADFADERVVFDRPVTRVEPSDHHHQAAPAP